MKTLAFIILTIVSLFISKSYAQNSFDVVVKGKGEPILLFPGFGCPNDVWNKTVAELSKTNECHLFTFAGFGNVSPIEMPWLSTIKDDVLNYVKTKKLIKPILLGHSLGGTLSLWLASLEPDLFKKVIVVDALPCVAALMIPNYSGEKFPYDNPQSKMMMDMGEEEFQAMNTRSAGFLSLNKDKQNLIVKWMNMADRKTYVNGYVDMLNLDLREEIAKIKIPVAILAATFPDKNVVKSTYESQYKNLLNVKIHYAENAAHFVMFDQPDWFIKNVIQSIR